MSAMPHGASSASSNGSTTPAPNLRTMAERVDALMSELRASASPAQAAAKAEEALSVVVQLYGAGLNRILEIVDERGGPAAQDVFNGLCGDDFVASLLILHDLHPQTTEQRVQAALDRVRTYLKSHEGDVELLRIEGDVAYLKMAGSCNGCPSSAVTMNTAIERAIYEAAPEITTIRAQGVREKSNTQRRASDWVSLGTLPGLDEHGMAASQVEGTPVLFLRSADTLLAYRSQCANCLTSLSGATLHWPLLTCAACAQTYDVVRAGRAPGRDDLWIEPFPLVAEGDRVRLAIPVTA